MQKNIRVNISQKIICFPGNAGTIDLAINIDVDILNFKKLLNLIKFYNRSCCSRTEEPLVKGIVDFLKKIKLKYLVQINTFHSSKALRHL